MNQGLVKGTLFVAAAALISKGLGSLLRVPIQNIAGDRVLGIFTLVYPLYMVVLTLSVAGIPLAISKLISEAKARESMEEIRNIFVTASILAFTFGVAGFLVLAFLSGPISNAFGGSSTRPAILVVSLSLLVAPYMAVYRGFFQGFGDMRPTSVSQVLEQSFRVFLVLAAGIVLVHSGAVTPYVAAGVMAGSSFGALASLVYLRGRFVRFSLKPRGERRYNLNAFSRLTKRILALSLPIAVGSLAMALLNLVDSFTVPLSLQAYGETAINELYGVYGRGLSLVQIATVFSTSLVLPMVPAVSSSIMKRKHGRTKQMIGRAQKYNHLISWPSALCVLALVMPLNLALFGDLQGTWILAVLGFSSLFNAFAVLGTGILSGVGLQKKAAFLVLGAAIIKIPLNIILVTNIGLIGAAISSLLVYGLLAGANVVLIKSRYSFSAFPKGTGTYIVSGVLTGALIGIPTLFFDVEAWSRIEAFVYVIVSIPAGIAFYGGLLWKFNGPGDFHGIPVIGRLVDKIERKERRETRVME